MGLQPIRREGASSPCAAPSDDELPPDLAVEVVEESHRWLGQMRQGWRLGSDRAAAGVISKATGRSQGANCLLAVRQSPVQSNAVQDQQTALSERLQAAAMGWWWRAWSCRLGRCGVSQAMGLSSSCERGVRKASPTRRIPQLRTHSARESRSVMSERTRQTAQDVW